MDLSKPIDMKLVDSQPFLESVQGNIIKGHGRDHTANVFLYFPAQAETVRTWIAEFARSRITTAAQQRAQTKEHKAKEELGKKRTPGDLFASFLLSFAGYKALGVEDENIPQDPFFQAGMKRHNTVLNQGTGEPLDPINDPEPILWEQGFRPDIHAMIILAHDDRADLEKNVIDLLADLDQIGIGYFMERGDKLKFDFGGAKGELEIEHFGHQDGVSNPRMNVEDIEEEAEDLGVDNWDPSAPLELVLVEEPNVTDGYGSYMVFRKLEQNVRKFLSSVGELATQLGIEEGDAAALVVGRHRDGTPTIPARTKSSKRTPNDFNFDNDRPDDPTAARLCPFHAHIRRSNPRGDIPHYASHLGLDLEFERSFRIARRGITYGERPDLYNPDLSSKPEQGVGLLFMSFQARVRQFAIQQSGSDGDAFPYSFQNQTDPFTGIDGVIGQPVDPATARPQPWPFGDPSGNEEKTFLMMDTVRMMGGEYFFAPSLVFLGQLRT